MQDDRQTETRLQGVALSEGCAVARVCLFNERRHSNLPLYKVHGTNVEHEVERFHQALALAGERLEGIRREVERKIGQAEGGIFVAQEMILRDARLRSDTIETIRREKVNAEMAITSVLDEYEVRLADLDNEYLKERASDFGEVKRRLLAVLSNMQPSLQCAGEEHCQRGKNRIVVAEEMTPALTVDLNAEHLMGLITERGGPTSHGAILARALGIPAVSGLPGIHSRLKCGTEILVNGATGEVVIWPSEATVGSTPAARSATLRMPAAVAPVPGLRDMANISSADEVQYALAMQAEGIGLYRTEIELIAAGALLSEEQLYDRYAAVAQAMQGRPVVFRLFDIGSDKPLPALALPPEDNPSLGWRGARLLLGKAELLRPQARALARLSAACPVNVLYPMIVDATQFVELRKRFHEAVADITCGEIRHGVMFEVPAACLQAAELMELADFASVGTNDLTQYLFAVDRGNEQVAYDYNPDRPVFWKLMRDMAQAARAAGKSLSVCGELAGDPKFVVKLRQAEIDTLSVNPRQIPGVRSAAAGLPHSSIHGQTRGH